MHDPPLSLSQCGGGQTADPLFSSFACSSRLKVEEFLFICSSVGNPGEGAKVPRALDLVRVSAGSQKPPNKGSGGRVHPDIERPRRVGKILALQNIDLEQGRNTVRPPHL